jgi:transcriptional regulator with XRE-family HTH domain
VIPDKLLLPVGRTLRIWREYRGLTLRELAVGLRLSEGLISRWETGKTSISLKNLTRAAAVLDLPPAALLLQFDGANDLDLVESVLRIVNTGRREDLVAWINLGARIVGVPPVNAAADQSPAAPPTPTAGAARRSRRPRRPTRGDKPD